VTPAVVVASGRWLRAGAFVAVAICIGGALGSWRVTEMAPAPASIRAPWVDACVARMERARLRLADVSTELGRAEVQQAWSVRAAWAELRLQPQYSARIEYRPAEDLPSVFDWEEAPTPVAGSFALHRRVGHFDLLVVADDSDDSGLAFAARMQPLLDECLIEAQE
jgi:hypothetical protein